MPQLFKLQKKAGLIKGKNTPESSRVLEARVATLEEKSENSSNDSLFIDIIKPKAVIGVIQPLRERKMAPDKAMQMPDG